MNHSPFKTAGKGGPPAQTWQQPPRETAAQRDLETTSFQRRTKEFLSVLFILILGVGLAAAGMGAVLKRLESDPESNRVRRAEERVLQRIEKEIEDASALVSCIRPRLQTALFQLFGEGNTQVVSGREGWLFFKKDIDYVSGRPFLDPLVVEAREKQQKLRANPLPAILDFKRQLDARGIRLLVVPIPVKPSVEGHELSRISTAEIQLRQNPSYRAFLAGLQSEGVDVLDAGPLLIKRRKELGEPQYLKSDTHWTPHAMEAVARETADKISADLSAEPVQSSATAARAFAISSRQESSRGDTAALLGTGMEGALGGNEVVETHPVSVDGARWRAAPDAEVLLLGDSFCNIFSFTAMGWGEGAGFAEHLSAALQKPVDTILRNSDGAYATREMLSRELAKGRDRLAGKKMVVWEFAARELAFGDWGIIPLQLGEPAATQFYCPPQGKRVQIEGTVSGVSAVPLPGATPYKEHIMSVHLVDVSVAGDGRSASQKQCVVYTWSMRDKLPAKAASLRPGDRVSWQVTAWDDEQLEKEKFQRSELEDTHLLGAPFAWSE